MGSSGFQAGDVRVFFQSRRANIEAHLATHLADFIAGTRETLDVAAYDLRHPEVLDALSRVAAAGKRVRIAYDSSKEHVGGLLADPKPTGTVEALGAAGLLQHATPIHHGRHLMHDKFLIRDGEEVWTGSANFTTGGLELQDNNCLVITSRALAATYTQAFEALLEDDESDRPTAPAPVSLDGMTVHPYFAPAAGERIEDAIRELLTSAHRVRVLAFLLSDPGILEALLPIGRDPQFDIRGIYDPHGMENVLRYTQQAHGHFWFTRDPRFVAAPTHGFNPHTEQDFMHNKVLIIDDRYVITGSYNFSENAEANDENLLLFDAPALAAAYTEYFDTLAATYAAHPAHMQPVHAAHHGEEEHAAHASHAAHAHHASHVTQVAHHNAEAVPVTVAATVSASAAASAHAGAGDSVGGHVGDHPQETRHTTENATPLATALPAADLPPAQPASVAVEQETAMPFDRDYFTPRAHVLQRGKSAAGLKLANSQAQLANEQVFGKTAHAIVFTDGTANGNASAQAVVNSFEADFAQITQWFGGLQLPAGQEGDDQTTVRTALPIQVAMDPNAGGAYHYGCNATDVYIEPDPSQATGLVVAEVVEIFEAAINNGWDCGKTNGEGLSRVLAVARNSTLAPLIAQTAQQWWADGAQDFVTNNSADDQNQDANGCGSLFLYYLNSQLNFSWTQIATTGGATLGECYQRLTGNSPAQGFSDFTSRLSTLAQGGQLQLPASGNPFPIQAQGQPVQPGSGGSTAGDPGLPSFPTIPAKGGLGAGITTVLVLIALVVIALVIALAGALH